MNAKANSTRPAHGCGLLAALSFLMLAASLAFTGKAWAQACPGAGGTFTADVVLFDTGILFNRMGAQNPNWMMYALKRDVVTTAAVNGVAAGALLTDPGLEDPGNLGFVRPAAAGNVELRPDKRPRPLVLRIPADSCLTVNFQNLLTPVVFQPPVNPNNCLAGDAAQQAQCRALLQNDNQVESQAASFHVAGMQVVANVQDDGTFVGANAANGIAVNPGDTKTYMLYAESEGAFLVTSHGATFGGEATGGNIGIGAFGMVAVQPREAKIYRSQVTEEEFRLASVPISPAHPEGIDYEAVYPMGAPWDVEGKAGKPILNMMDGNTVFHSEINAIVAYKDPTSGAFTNFPDSTYPLESVNKQNPSVPNRLEPFRDFASLFHDETAVAQAFPAFFSRFATPAGVDQNPLAHALHSVRDSFMINYGSGGIGSEIIANRLGVGPMYDCLGCAYEEFFLTSFTVGDPAMLVDIPANAGLETCNPLLGGQAPCDATQIGQKANEAFYPEDPANVHHSYTGDKAKYRNVHAGPKEQHIFHLHNNQWLFNANDDNSNYLDAQGIGPGSSYTYEINYGGGGNRNKTAGDAIFHCHFYPHFAQGMWYLWRIHDVRETGTVLAASGGTVQAPGIHTTQWGLRSGLPMAGARATPDGEIIAGTPIPAVVPLPGKPLPPVPGAVSIVAKDVNNDGTPDSSQVHVDRTDLAAGKNPGYPFWIAGMDCGGAATPACPQGIVGQRPPTPLLDMVTVAQATDLVDNDPFYAQFKVGNPNYRDSFINAAGGFNGGLPRHSLEGCKAIIKQLNDDGLITTGAATGCSILDAAIGGAAAQFHPVFATAVSKLDMHKEVLRSKAVFFPEAGTDVEKVAMAAHAVRTDPVTGFVLNGGPPVPGAPYSEPCIDDQGAVFYDGVNGQFFNSSVGGIGGGKYQGSPADGRSATSPFTYKAANIQIDAVFNKVGYHYPQQRIIALWNDVLPTINKTRAPEPFVMRLNTFDCAKYLHTNLVPKEFEVDDYQVRTPTDIIGQHIHLPKWDLTTTDGAANGWNYEDGTLSPGMVQERIHAIRDANGCTDPDPRDGTTTCPVVGYPTDTDFPSMAGFPEWDGARVTIQRWFVDPVYNVLGDDRGLGIVFTHDHYGPSTFQQIGLYSTLLVEPAGSTWKHNETGTALGTRTDGGPTSWQAAIEPGAGSPAFEAFREFYFEFSDFQHAYEAGVYVGAGQDGRPQAVHDPVTGVNNTFPVTADSFRNAMNPSFRQQAVGGPNLGPVPANNPAFPDIVRFPAVCPDGSPRPCPEAITADDSGMLVVNYRHEPVGLRVFDPAALGPDGNPGTQAAGLAGDLAFALQSREDRAIPQMNVQPVAGTPAVPAIPIFPTGTQLPTTFADSEGGDVPLQVQAALKPGDPYTPMIRAKGGDLVKIKVQSGATEHEHSMSIHGVKWPQAGSGHGAAPNSGWRNAQGDGISEQFTFNAPMAFAPGAEDIADHAYSVDVSQDGWWSGMWGIMRVYRTQPAAGQLYSMGGGDVQVANADQFDGACPLTAPVTSYTLLAVSANDVLTQTGLTLTIPDNQPVGGLNNNVGAPLNPNGGTLVLNPRNPGGPAAGPLHDPTALMYVRLEDVEAVPGQGGNVCADSAGTNPRPGVANPQCQIQLKDNAPLEPAVLRANAGDCIKVTVWNRVAAQVDEGQPLNPVGDLAGYNTLLQMVIRNRQAPGQAGDIVNGLPANSVTTFNNNLIRPSSHVGLHPQLVAYDVTKDDGVNVGINGLDALGNVVEPQVATPGNSISYTWYAGDLRFKPVAAKKCGRRNTNPCKQAVATPVEFGGTNLIPADKVKQGQKGLIAALVIEPPGSTWPDALASLTDTERDRQQNDPNVTRKTRADVTVNCAAGDSFACPKGAFDDLVVMVQKGNNHRLSDGTAVPNIASEGQGIPEDSHDAGQKGVNYGSEPAWFRFGLAPDANFGRGPGEFGAQADAWKMYHNSQVGGEDPATPVYDVGADAEARMRVLEPTGVGRGTTFAMHGHLWQRDPYVCVNADGTPVSTDGLAGKCASVAPDAMGTNLGDASARIGRNPIGMALGGQESVQPYQHFEVRLENTGGANGIWGDYLFRDQASFGNTDGIWGLLRVAQAEPNSCAGNQAPTAEANGPYSGPRRQPIAFTSDGSSDPDGDITSYVWAFGDGGTSSEPNPTHSYRGRGTFTATLTVTDNCGATASDTATVTVSR